MLLVEKVMGVKMGYSVQIPKKIRAAKFHPNPEILNFLIQFCHLYERSNLRDSTNFFAYTPHFY